MNDERQLAKTAYHGASFRARLWPHTVVTVVALGMVVQAALIAGLVVYRARRRRGKQQVGRREAALHSSGDRTQSLGWRLLKAHDEERARIARELHDDISQQLAVLTLDLQLLGRATTVYDESAAALVLKRIEEIGRSVHDLSHRLHPARLRLLGLVEALEELKREVSGPNVRIALTHQNVPATLAPDLTLCLFRIVQEGLQNALKHGRARDVSVTLTGRPAGIDLTITDDGVGFDVEAAWHSGIGLISVNERVKAIAGNFKLRSSPGAGTRLEVRVPVPPCPEITGTTAARGR